MLREWKFSIWVFSYVDWHSSDETLQWFIIYSYLFLSPSFLHSQSIVQSTEFLSLSLISTEDVMDQPEISFRLYHKSVTIIWFIVRVPVLSEQITVVAPNSSEIIDWLRKRRKIYQLDRASLCTHSLLPFDVHWFEVETLLWQEDPEEGEEWEGKGRRRGGGRDSLAERWQRL